MSKFTRIILNFIIGINILLISGCTNNAPVTTKQAGTLSSVPVVTVKKGTVVSVKNVAIAGGNSRVVGTVGSIAGSVLGSSIPYAGSIIGSMIGGAVGSEADKEINKQKGLEITLLLDNGEKLVVTQLAEISFKTGDKVKLTVQNNKAEVTHLKIK